VRNVEYNESKRAKTGDKAMKPNTEILRKALYELKHLHGVTLQDATKQSDVHNLQKIIDGKIEPTPNSWWKLHTAFPKEIPEPSYIDGTRIYKNITADHDSNAAGPMVRRGRTCRYALYRPLSRREGDEYSGSLERGKATCKNYTEVEALRFKALLRVYFVEQGR
jgi:hypothetical protein